MASNDIHAAPVDQAMGLELQAIELEDALEWAEQQGRSADVTAIRRDLFAVLDELGRVSDRIAA